MRTKLANDYSIPIKLTHQAALPDGSFPILDATERELYKMMYKALYEKRGPINRILKEENQRRELENSVCVALWHSEGLVPMNYSPEMSHMLQQYQSLKQTVQQHIPTKECENQIWTEENTRTHLEDIDKASYINSMRSQNMSFKANYLMEAASAGLGQGST